MDTASGAPICFSRRLNGRTRTATRTDEDGLLINQPKILK